MNILFVVPCYPKRITEYLILPSIEVCIMSSILKEEGHCVSLLDMQIDDYKIESIESLLGKFAPDIMCIDDGLQVHCNSRKIIAAARKVYGKDVIICMRGEISSFIPRTVMERNPELDIILRYETDFSLLKIIHAIRNRVSYFDIAGIAYRMDGNIIVTTLPNRPTDLSLLPKADRRLYDIAKYLKRDTETIAKSSRGCVGNCAFCTKTRFERFQLFPMSYFCDELQELTSYGFESFFFSDNVFAISMKRLIEFQNELEKRNLKVRWTSNIRIKDITREKIALMKKLGAYRVFVGIETINSGSSKLINKNLSRNEILEKVSILKEQGIEFHASFILGSPGDTEVDLEETIKFVKIMQPTIVTFNLLKVFPGLPIYDHPDQYGIIMDPYWYETDKWASQVVMGTKTLTPTTLEKWSRRMLFEFMN